MDLKAKYRNARKKIILLDYDGTLVNFTITPDKAKPSVRLLNILHRLTCEPSTKIVIITGREYRSIDNLIGHLPIDIVAEHGAMIKENGIWNDQINNNVLWKHEFLPMLRQFTSECRGSFIEEKRFSIAWHYRDVDFMGGYIFSRELIRKAHDKIAPYTLRIIDGGKTVEIMRSEANKGKAINHFIKKSNFDFVLCIGDSLADEDMFEVLKENDNYLTIKVGYGNTSAKYTVSSPEDVLQLLERL